MRLSLVHWLIAAAVLANVAVYYWQQSQSQPTDGPAPVNGLRELKLLGEVEARGSSEAGPVTLPLEMPATTAEVEPLTAEQPDAGETSVESPATGAGAVALEFEESASASAAANQPQPAAAPPEAPPRCWLAGPVDNDALSEQLTAAFAAAGVSMDLVLQATEVSPDNWVYLPTSGEQADVRRLSRELRQAGFDNFPINDGPLAGSLSLGLFRSQERAFAVRDTLRERGYQADIFERPAFAEQPWISLDERGRIALDWPAVEGELPGFEALRLLAVECLPQS